jgi:hypothetical protein
VRNLSSIALFVLLSLNVNAIHAASPPNSSPSCADLRAEKSKIYGFHLAQLNETQLDAKTKELDTFWKNVQAAGPEGVTCIRSLLAEEKTDHIFQVDAAGMLFPADPSPETRNLIRDS